MLGLKRGTVVLCPHEKEWEEAAQQTISLLRSILGDTAVDIQHVGSTAIRGISAKPILDLVVAVRSLEDIAPHAEALAQNGFIDRGQDRPGQHLFVMGDLAADTRTHHIHIVEYTDPAWKNYINFRDYCNAHPAEAARYDALKRRLCAEHADNRALYTPGKQDLINELLEKAAAWRASGAVCRKSVGTQFSMCVQPAFLIGTNNEDGTHNFAPITWLSVTCEGGDDYLLVVSMFGTKRTRRNVEREGVFSANLVSTDMLPLMDYFGAHSAADGPKDAVPYAVGRGQAVDVPVLEASRWVYECEVVQTVVTGASATFFCRIKNVQIDARLDIKDTFAVDLTALDPVIYSGKYHSVGRLLGDIGDFLK
ncbi:MAG: GrpB family protein [Clostridia bacterium]|nr:GrpB family protein [Clostridia bacterium]